MLVSLAGFSLNLSFDYRDGSIRMRPREPTGFNDCFDWTDLRWPDKRREGFSALGGSIVFV